MSESFLSDVGGQAEDLRAELHQVRAELEEFRAQANASGVAGSKSFLDFGNALNTVSKTLGVQNLLHKATRDALKEVKKGFEELVAGAVAFGRAQESAFNPKNFNQLMRSLRDGLSVVLGTSGSGLFQQIKGLVADLNGLVSSGGFAGGIRAIDDGIAAAVAQAREFVRTLNTGSLKDIGQAIGTSIKVVAEVAGPIVRGAAQGLADLAKIFNLVANQIAKNLNIEDFGKMVQQITRIAVIITALVAPVAALLTAALQLPGHLLLAGLALVGVAAGALGIETRFGTIRKLVGDGLANAIDVVLNKLTTMKLRLEQAAAFVKGDLAKVLSLQLDVQSSQANTDAAIAKFKKDVGDALAANGSAETLAGFVERVFKEGLDRASQLIDLLLPGFIDKTREKLVKPKQPFFDQLFFGEGGLAEFLVRAEDGVLQAAEIIKNVFNSTAAFIADAIVSAFDPNNKQDLRQRFATFLQGIAKMILESTIKRALASIFDTVISGASGLSGVGGLAGGVAAATGKASGGEVGRSGVASLAHAFARGFARGGRPTGLPASDTVPAWLTPGEWVMSLPAVRAYGPHFMAMLNGRMIDPAPLQALAGGRGPAGGSATGPGYAAGGLVADRMAGSGRERVTQVVLPAIVANNHNMAQLLAGGEAAFFSFLGQNKGRVAAELDLHGGRS